jgi:hypothetical protein
MTRTTRLRRMILHLAHIFLTDARTFIDIASVRGRMSIPAREGVLYLIVALRMQVACGVTASLPPLFSITMR